MLRKNSKGMFGTRIKVLLTLLPVLFTGSCTSIPELQVQYTLPSPSEPLKGRAVALTIEDQRTSPSILGRGAEDDFEGFSGSVSLSIADAGNKALKVGIFQVPNLMKEAFTRRLQNTGLKVLSESTSGVPRLVINVKVFSLDLIGREWLAKMSYEAKLIGENGAEATQFVNGEARRYKVIGREGVDILLGDVFTDMVNSLNPVRLFTQAGL